MALYTKRRQCTNEATDNGAMLTRALTVLVWILVLTSALAWLLAMTQANTSAPQLAPTTPQKVATVPALAPIQRLLGASTSAVPPSFDAQLQLTGVIASPHNQTAGAALIAINGKPSQAYKMGAPINGNLVLQSVNTRSALVGPANGSTSMKLELPRPGPRASAPAAAAAAAAH